MQGPKRSFLPCIVVYKRPCVVIDVDWDMLYTGDVFG